MPGSPTGSGRSATRSTIAATWRCRAPRPPTPAILTRSTSTRSSRSPARSPTRSSRRRVRATGPRARRRPLAGPGRLRRPRARPRAGRGDLARCACGLQHAGDEPHRQRPRHAARGRARLGRRAIDVRGGPPPPWIDEHRSVIIGARDLDDGERLRLRGSGVAVHTMTEIDRLGMERAVRSAIERVEGAPFVHVSLDLDVVDPSGRPVSALRCGAGSRSARRTSRSSS